MKPPGTSAAVPLPINAPISPIPCVYGPQARESLLSGFGSSAATKPAVSALGNASVLRIFEMISRAANEARTAEEALQVCLDSICVVTGWPVGHAYVVSPENPGYLESVNAWHLASRKKYELFRSRTQRNDTEVSSSLPGRVLKERTPIYVADLVSDPNFLRTAAARMAGLRAGVGFPIWTGKQVGGVLEFFSDRNMKFTDFLLKILTSAGTQMGRVIERTITEKSIRSLSAAVLRAQDEERRRIARELHDSTGQQLALIKIKLGSILSATGDQRELNRELSDCNEMISQCVNEVRTIAYLLHPPIFEVMGLAPALECYVNGFVQRSQISVSLEVDRNIGRLDREIETTLFRIVQEALTNVHRHSGSQTARIKLGGDTTTVFVEISDSGKGMPRSRTNKTAPGLSGVGIASMHERMRALKGKLDIRSSICGTVVRACVPRNL